MAHQQDLVVMFLRVAQTQLINIVKDNTAKASQIIPIHVSCILNRVRTLLSFSILMTFSMTFSNFPGPMV